MLAIGGDIGQYGFAEDVVLTGESIHTFSVVLRVVVDLPSYCFGGLVDWHGLDEEGVIGIVEEGWRNCK
jgi:hypothetical protein